VTGEWITVAETTDPAYWGRQMREPVQFLRGLDAVLERGDAILLEVGPGTALTGLARRRRPVVASLRHAEDPAPDRDALLAALGQLWLAGVPVDWEAFARPEPRRRVPLPTYPFERESYLLGRRGVVTPAAPEPAARPVPAPKTGETAFERHVLDIWRELLGIDAIDRSASFFDLGGDSLLATMLLARLVEVFGVDVPLRLVFESPTVTGLAGRIEQLMLERIARDGGLQDVAEEA
jgi:phthiocerol/phenolphthiocerol synthesis type-I polyketide synthase E